MDEIRMWDRAVVYGREGSVWVKMVQGEIETMTTATVDGKTTAILFVELEVEDGG